MEIQQLSMETEEWLMLSIAVKVSERQIYILMLNKTMNQSFNFFF